MLDNNNSIIWMEEIEIQDSLEGRVGIKGRIVIIRGWALYYEYFGGSSGRIDQDYVLLPIFSHSAAIIAIIKLNRPYR